MSDNVREFYDIFAEEYGQIFFSELDNKPYDRYILSRYAGLLQNQGLVCDMGCGVGHIGYFLSRRGIKTLGIDLSEEMISEARKLCPELDFQQGDMFALPYENGFFAGIVSFYSIVHLRLPEVKKVIKEFRRLVGAGGLLLLACHVGDGIVSVEKSKGDRCRAVEYIFLNPDDIIQAVKESGFLVEEAVVRYPYDEVEYPSKRIYVLARAV